MIRERHSQVLQPLPTRKLITRRPRREMTFLIRHDEDDVGCAVGHGAPREIVPALAFTAWLCTYYWSNERSFEWWSRGLMAEAADVEVAENPRFGPRAIRSVRLFSTEPGAPRARRPTDAVLLAVGLVTLLVASWAAEPPGALSRDVTQLAEDSPEWVSSIWQIFFDFLPLWAAILIVLSIVRRHFVLAGSMVAAIVVGFLVSYASHRIALGDPLDFGEFIRLFTRSEGPAVYPGVRLVAGTAVLVAASPAVSRPFRFFGRVVLGLGFFASLGLGAATLAGSIGGLAAGAAAAAAVHLATGSPGGRPSSKNVTATLAELGVCRSATSSRHSSNQRVSC